MINALPYQSPQSHHLSFAYSRKAFSSKDDAASAAGEEEAKESAKDFIAQAKEETLIDEITAYDQWKTKVMDEKRVPIILDCYADWCQPCRKLTPVLEKLTEENEGKFKLVKVNIDNSPQIAQGLNVKSIPALFLIYRGNIMDSITGVDTKKLENLIETALLIEKASHDESIMTQVLSTAETYIEEGNYKQAGQILQDGNTYEQWRDKYGTQMLIGIAYCELMESQDTQKARETLSPDGSSDH
jgi:thioredoxin